jgi:hypothetical protein
MTELSTILFLFFNQILINDTNFFIKLLNRNLTKFEIVNKEAFNI